MNTIELKSYAGLSVDLTDQQVEDLVGDDTSWDDTSKRSDTAPVSIDLLSDHDKSQHEEHLEKRIAITESWKRVEQLLGNETVNTWALGDELSWLASQQLTFREIADRVGRGHSYVESLVATAKWFPAKYRNPGYTWFSHDLLRRAANRFHERLKISLLPDAIDNSFKALLTSRARTTKDAANALVKAQLKLGAITDEQAAHFWKQDSTKDSDIHLFEITLKVNKATKECTHSVNLNGQRFFELVGPKRVTAEHSEWYRDLVDTLRTITKQFEDKLQSND